MSESFNFSEGQPQYCSNQNHKLTNSISGVDYLGEQDALHLSFNWKKLISPKGGPIRSKSGQKGTNQNLYPMIPYI